MPVVLAGDRPKLLAFLRRDLLTAMSYPTLLVGDLVNLLVEAAMFYFVGQLVSPGALPDFGGSSTTYLEFVAIGIVFATLVQVVSARAAEAIRQEQLFGTLESLLMTPTSYTTVLLGSVLYDLVYLPLRAAVLLLVLIASGGVDVSASGIVPALLLVALFLPFVLGLGMASAAATLRYKRGAGALTLGTSLLLLASGTVFPLDVLPGVLATVAEQNPIAVALDALRESLLGGNGWAAVQDAAGVLVAASAVVAAAGYLAFHAAIRHERRRGTLGFY